LSSGGASDPSPSIDTDRNHYDHYGDHAAGRLIYQDKN
jgi:hypothetical protein